MGDIVALARCGGFCAAVNAPRMGETDAGDVPAALRMARATSHGAHHGAQTSHEMVLKERRWKTCGKICGLPCAGCANGPASRWSPSLRSHWALERTRRSSA